MKHHTRALILSALLLAPAVAQTTQPKPITTTPLVFKDVPASHWAREAITILALKGLIGGYPDGTFGTNRPITRGEAALIFTRVLQSGALGSAALTAEDMNTIARGLQDLASELIAVKARLADAEETIEAQRARLAELQGQVKSTQAQLAQLNASVNERFAALEAKQAALEGKQATLEGKQLTLEGTQSTMKTTLKTTTPAAPTSSQATTSPSPDVTALAARVAQLEQTAQRPVPETYAQTPTTPKFPKPEEPVFREPQEPNQYVSIGGTTGTSGGMGYEATFGIKRLAGPLGLRGGIGFENGALNVEALGTLQLNSNDIRPYAGFGAGMTFSPLRTNLAETTRDTYLTGVLGLSYEFGGGMALFAEGAGRYYLSNTGTGTNLAASAGNGFGVRARFGAMFTF